MGKREINDRQGTGGNSSWKQQAVMKRCRDGKHKRSLIVNERCVRVEGESKHSSGSYASIVARAVLIGSFPQLVSEAASTFILQ